MLKTIEENIQIRVLLTYLLDQRTKNADQCFKGRRLSKLLKEALFVLRSTKRSLPAIYDGRGVLKKEKI